MGRWSDEAAAVLGDARDIAEFYWRRPDERMKSRIKTTTESLIATTRRALLWMAPVVAVRRGWDVAALMAFEVLTQPQWLPTVISHPQQQVLPDEKQEMICERPGLSHWHLAMGCALMIVIAVCYAKCMRGKMRWERRAGTEQCTRGAMQPFRSSRARADRRWVTKVKLAIAQSRPMQGVVLSQKMTPQEFFAELQRLTEPDEYLLLLESFMINTDAN